MQFLNHAFFLCSILEEDYGGMENLTFRGYRHPLSLYYGYRCNMINLCLLCLPSLPHTVGPPEFYTHGHCEFYVQMGWQEKMVMHVVHLSSVHVHVSLSLRTNKTQIQRLNY